MRVENYELYPFWDPEGIAEPYLLDLRAQASWGGFDPNRPVYEGLILALRGAYGPSYDYQHISRELAEIDQAARRARSVMKVDPRLLASVFDKAEAPPAWVPPVPADRRYVEPADKRDGAAAPPRRPSSRTWSGPQTYGPAKIQTPPVTATVQPARSERSPSPPAAQATVAKPRPDPAPAPTATEARADPPPRNTPQMTKLQGARLHRSIAPTWFALVGCSWVALIWGAIISMPVGIGFGILGGMLFGVILVPLAASVFGFAGMSSATASTLREFEHELVADDDPLQQAAKRYSAQLGIPAPRLCSMSVDNAFAMGGSPRKAIVAIGRPLREYMTEQELLAVLGHELGHVVSGDMRRMMLMRCFQNTTVCYMCAQGAKQFMRWVISWAGELFILSFSRKREFWADAIGAELAGKEAMIGALRALHKAPPLTKSESTHARFMIRGRFSGLLNTHPSFEQRVQALELETYLKRLPRA